jgi:hypothetical protein
MWKAKLLILWFSAVAICFTLYTYGEVKYHWYANDAGRGYAIKEWKGQTLDSWGSKYGNGYSFQYYIYRFENNPEVRIVFIILILAGSAVGTLSIWKHKHKANV